MKIGDVVFVKMSGEIGIIVGEADADRLVLLAKNNTAGIIYEEFEFPEAALETPHDRIRREFGLLVFEHELKESWREKEREKAKDKDKLANVAEWEGSIN